MQFLTWHASDRNPNHFILMTLQKWSNHSSKRYFCIWCFLMMVFREKKGKRKRTYPKCFKTGPPVIRMNWYLDPYTYAVSINDLCSKVTQSAETIQLIWLVIKVNQSDNLCLHANLQITIHESINQQPDHLHHWHFASVYPSSPSFSYLVFPDCGRNPARYPSSLWLPSPWPAGQCLCERTWPLHAEWHLKRKTERQNRHFHLTANYILKGKSGDILYFYCEKTRTKNVLVRLSILFDFSTRSVALRSKLLHYNTIGSYRRKSFKTANEYIASFVKRCWVISFKSWSR